MYFADIQDTQRLRKLNNKPPIQKEKVKEKRRMEIYLKITRKIINRHMKQLSLQQQITMTAL